MAHLAVVGSHTVNGVAAIHSELLKSELFFDFQRIFPGKFINVTNGITPRRWLNQCNPRLTELIASRIGFGFVRDLSELKKLAAYAGDAEFRKEFRAVKQANKLYLAEHIEQVTGTRVDPDSLFDVQAKRIHEYKRQLLNVLHVITLYNRIRSGQADGVTPRTVIFGGKAAPGYRAAKLIVHLINDVAGIVNNDPAVGNLLKVVFYPNYDVSTAEKIFPASELSEQISTAGTEASLRARGYNPWDYYNGNAELRQAMDMIGNGFFSVDESDRYRSLFDNLTKNGDFYLLLADYASYIAAQDKVSALYRDQEEWTRRAILNVANMGKFSSDRTIQEYADKVWKVQPVAPACQLK